MLASDLLSSRRAAMHSACLLTIRIEEVEQAVGGDLSEVHRVRSAGKLQAIAAL